MKTKKRTLRKMSLKLFYLLSSFGVALIACSVIGLLLFFSSISALNKLSLAQLTDKIGDLTENISVQQKAMKEISLNLSTKLQYKKNLLDINSYNDVRLLKDFCQYQTWTQISDTYFLFYSGESKVYICSPVDKTGSTCTFDFFFTRMIPVEDAGNLYGQLDAVTRFTVIQASENGVHTLIFAYPVYTMGRDNPAGKATLGFIISNGLLSTHASALAGELPENVALIASDGADAVINGEMPDLSASGNTLVKESSDGKFKIAFEPPAAVGFSLQKTFNTLYIAVALLLVMAAAVLIGYTNYMPIKRLSRKYLTGGETKSRNEIDTIETYFDYVLSQKGSLETDLLKQYEMIKRQILELLLSGDTGYASLVRQSFMGIDLPGPEYLVVALVSEREMGEEETNGLAKQIETLSERGLVFYLIRSTVKNCYAVLVNLPEYGNTEENTAVALDYVSNLFESTSVFRMAASSVFDDVVRLPKAFGKALAKCSAAKNEDANAFFWFDEAMAGNMVDAISRKKSEAVNRCFHEFAKAVMANTKTYAYEKMAFFRLLSKLGAYADGEGIHIEPAVIDRIMSASDRQEMIKSFAALLRTLSDEGGFPGDDAREKGRLKAADILRYLNENYADSGLCLDGLSDKFNISNRYISSIIKAETGFSYKDYLTDLRIQKARHLLQGGFTVTKTCETVGYVDLANFIKAFKHITGYTPAVFASRKEDPAGKIISEEVQNEGSPLMPSMTDHIK